MASVILKPMEGTGMVFHAGEIRLWHSAPSYHGGVLQVLHVEQSVVDPEDDPVEEGTVQGLCHGVSHRAGLNADTHRIDLATLTSQLTTFDRSRGESETVSMYSFSRMRFYLLWLNGTFHCCFYFITSAHYLITLLTLFFTSAKEVMWLVSVCLFVC